MIATSTPETRCCSVCAEVQPLVHFRLRYKSDPSKGRAWKCRQCHNDQERLRQKKKRLKLNGQVLNQFARLLGQATRPRDAHRLVEAMVRRFGGVGRLAETWGQHLDAAREKDAGGRTMGNGLIATLRLIEFCEPPPLDLTNLNQADLERAVVQSFANGIRGNPGLVIGILQEVGYTVLPPE